MAFQKIGCKKCGQLMAFGVNEMQKQCPNCGVTVKNEVTCLACGHVGRNADFADSICSKCGWSGLARSEDEAERIADRLRKLTGKTGQVQVQGEGGRAYIK